MSKVTWLTHLRKCHFRTGQEYLGSWAFFLAKSGSPQRFLFDRNTWGLNELIPNLFKTKHVFHLHPFDNPRPNFLMTWDNRLEIPVLQQLPSCVSWGFFCGPKLGGLCGAQSYLCLLYVLVICMSAGGCQIQEMNFT